MWVLAAPAAEHLESAPARIPARPWASNDLSNPVRAKLEAGFGLAMERASEVPGCRQLFAELGSDPVVALASTLYYPAALKQELGLCRQVLAYTVVDGRPTWLCRRFAKLSDERAAIVLLHEALHRAGQGESHRRDGPAPRAIDRRVRTSCHL